ncbi:cobyrinate a,c-diamide synthase [Rhizobium sp. SSA_523]|uniref:cobyrinate a,c-diamide synthase n=1 Tax=Rhizobium sp. SSA_523 TaxID=2952477 RepID=UPI002091C04E|nr:cobyrinate a,c-diamide synthase [Rhizobium sp. SSA_523]MCO5734503.1 cobyrinate a,c-diamide synthase [Rhizobium sp. SSA_523]WKC23252.1 cobyrinate a,c-diamide synthase [Rhizobium sp. SSA_523]
MTKALIIGAPRSGSGKTSVTIGLLRAFARRGIRVRGIKSGPDYIDPGFHQAATGIAGLNLDSWAMEPPLVQHLLANAAEGIDLLLIESAMGLFDGIAGGEGRTGSAADLSRLLGIPVLLVLDISGQSQTAAAVAVGFRHYDQNVRMAGVVLNRAGSERHVRLSRAAIESAGLSVVGAVLRDSMLSLPERHLGLVQATEHPAIESHIDRLADAMESALDLDAILSLAVSIAPEAGSPSAHLSPPGQRIAIASDAAFTFLYPHLGHHWRQAGAELVAFSPLADEAPPGHCDACWLPGGYPELFAGRIAAAHKFRAGLADFAATRPVHGECGGYMVLGESLEDAEGQRHTMTGLLSHSTSFATRKMNLGYRQATLLSDGALGRAGQVIRGHEFHYARVTDAGRDEAFAAIADGTGSPIGLSGGRRALVSGTFFHAIAAVTG